MSACLARLTDLAPSSNELARSDDAFVVVALLRLHEQICHLHKDSHFELESIPARGHLCKATTGKRLERQQLLPQRV